jgi:hypothetical protein
MQEFILILLVMYAQIALVQWTKHDMGGVKFKAYVLEATPIAILGFLAIWFLSIVPVLNFVVGTVVWALLIDDKWGWHTLCNSSLGDLIKKDDENE